MKNRDKAGHASFEDRRAALSLFFNTKVLKEKLPVASSVDCYVFLRNFLCFIQNFFHNVDTFYAYNETIVNNNNNVGIIRHQRRKRG